jgi:hypothetical protein
MFFGGGGFPGFHPGHDDDEGAGGASADTEEYYKLLVSSLASLYLYIKNTNN